VVGKIVGIWAMVNLLKGIAGEGAAVTRH